MTWWSLVLGIIAVIFIVVGFGVVVPGGLADLPSCAVGPAGSVPGGPGVRAGSTTLVKEFLGHTRMLKWGIVGAAHWFVMIGFGALFLTLVQAVGETFSPSFEIPWLGYQDWYGLFVELIALTTVLGIGTLITIRQLNHPRRAARKSRFEGSNFWQAYFVESVILAVGLCIFRIRGFQSATGLLPYPAWAAPISTWLGSWLPAWLWAYQRRRADEDDHLDGVGDRDRQEPVDGRGLAPVPGVLQHLLQAGGLRPHRVGGAARRCCPRARC